MNDNQLQLMSKMSMDFKDFERMGKKSNQFINLVQG